MTRCLLYLSVAAVVLWCGSLAGAEPPRILELRTQKMEGATYFHLRLERPADLRFPAFDTSRPFAESDRGKFARLPRLVPQDGTTRTVYYRHKPTAPSLSFFGQVMGDGDANALLLYPSEVPPAAKDARENSSTTAEVPLKIDFAKARAVPLPKLDPQDQHLHPDDLRGHWALHQAAHFALLETQVLDFPFYSFAREATGRKYGVVAPAWVKRQLGDLRHRLYEITTGADAIAETLQLHRMLQPDRRPVQERSVPLSQLAGVTVPEQPWERLLEGKEPSLEPLARFIPHDNYYLHFGNIRKFIELGELLDQWGTSLIRVYEMKSRDCQLRQRYERQLCLRTTALGKTLGPALIKGLAVTGHDPYVREGTDVTVVFQVTSRPLFLAAVEGFIQEARREYGDALVEGRDEHHGTPIERFVTPLREVSLHRASFADKSLGEIVIYSNSPAGVRRVLDARQGRGKCLAGASDFRYMRTVFPLADKPKEDKTKDDNARDSVEDGFVFLSDAFIRQLTGPASRIKEKRRLEALTSASMLTSAALFCAWEFGKLPADHAAVLAGAGLRPEDIAVPHGRGVFWDPRRQLAVSDVYNAIHFATPLVELSIDQVTPLEAEEYGRFREEYSRLWRTYFDPIGLRLTLDDQRVQIETHILPLAGSEQYRSLRELAGQGTFRFEPRKLALLDLRLSLLPKTGLSLQLDGDGVLREMIGLLIRWEADPTINLRQEYDRLFWKLPLGAALFGESDDDRLPAGGADGLVTLLKSDSIVKEAPAPSQYKEVTLHKLTIHGERYRELAAFLPALSGSTPLATVFSLLPTQEAPTALYIAMIDGAVHISANEDFLKKRIDETEAAKTAEKKAAKKPPPGREVHAALSIAPGNAREAASRLLEHEAHSLALLNNQIWNCFYQGGLLEPGAAGAARKDKEGDRKSDKRGDQGSEIVRRFLGFVPVSPDASVYEYEPRLREVVSRRHGTHRQPEPHRDLEKESELGRLLDQIQALRAELRFHDNGLHTVVTIERR